MSTSLAREGAGQANRIERSVALAEAVCFARDLGGTLVHVLLAAVGRAAGTDHGVGVGPAIAVALPATDALLVPEACSAPLPRLRSVVDALLAGVRPAERVAPDGLPAILVAVEEPGEPSLAAPAGGSAVVLLALDDGTALAGRLTVTVGRGGCPEAADRLLHEVAYLLEHPYRRLG
jgi:hypothetical protein